MAIIKKINSACEFVDEFKQWEQRRDQFSAPALVALFEYLEEFSDDMGEDVELDVVAICCDWSEYESLKAFNSDNYYDEPSKYESLDDLRDMTTVIEFDGGIIVGAF
jgi:hypothetical protein